MLKSLLLAALAAAVTVGVGYADRSTSKVVIPVNRTSPTSGKQMFTSYCAPCHGVDGRGHGPAAAALKIQPADLTELVRKNNGKFPDMHVASVLQFGVAVPAHGSAEMPVWGPILGTMSKSNPLDKTLRINNLSRYIESIQTR